MATVAHWAGGHCSLSDLLSKLRSLETNKFQIKRVNLCTTLLLRRRACLLIRQFGHSKVVPPPLHNVTSAYFYTNCSIFSTIFTANISTLRCLECPKSLQSRPLPAHHSQAIIFTQRLRISLTNLLVFVFSEALTFAAPARHRQANPAGF